MNYKTSVQEKKKSTNEKNVAKKIKIDNLTRSKREKSKVEKFIQFNDIFSYNLDFLYEIVIFFKNTN